MSSPVQLSPEFQGRFSPELSLDHPKLVRLFQLPVFLQPEVLEWCLGLAAQARLNSEFSPLSKMKQQLGRLWDLLWDLVVGSAGQHRLHGLSRPHSPYHSRFVEYVERQLHLEGFGRCTVKICDVDRVAGLWEDYLRDLLGSAGMRRVDATFNRNRKLA